MGELMSVQVKLQRLKQSDHETEKCSEKLDGPQVLTGDR